MRSDIVNAIAGELVTGEKKRGAFVAHTVRDLMDVFNDVRARLVLCGEDPILNRATLRLTVRSNYVAGFLELHLEDTLRGYELDFAVIGDVTRPAQAAELLQPRLAVRGGFLFYGMSERAART